MPSNLLNVDTGFPDLSGNRSTDEKFRMVSDYLYMLREQLQYSMANLGRENFNDSSFDDIAHIINEPVYVRLEDTDGKLSSLIQTVDGFDLRVENGETSSVIRLMSGRAEISSQVIRMSGLVTFTGLENGTTVIDGACIRTGSVIADVSIQSPTIRGGRFYNTGGDAYLELGGSGQGDLTLWGSGSNRVFRVYDNIGSASLSCYGRTFLTVGLGGGAAEGSWDFSGADVTGLYLRFT